MISKYEFVRFVWFVVNYLRISSKEPLINLTLISGSLLFFSFSCGKLRKTIIK